MISSITQSTSGPIATVTVTSSLTLPVWFFWYLDGVYAGMTTGSGAPPTSSKSFVVSGQVTINVIDSNSSTPPADPPVGYPATRTLVFTRSIDPTIDYYIVQQQEADSGTWTPIATLFDQPGTWVFSVQTNTLLDLTDYQWRVVPYDVAGNAGTPTAIGDELIVRTPDAPDFSVSLTVGTNITFAEVA